MGVLSTVSDPNVQHMFKKHWPWFVAGGLGLAWVAYSYLSSGSSSSTTPSTSTTTSGGSGGGSGVKAQDATQIALANIAANAETQVATIQAGQAIRTANIEQVGSDYQSLVNAQATQSNTLTALGTNQNIQMLQALESGFANYATSTAQIASAAASGAASTASATDASSGSNALTSVIQGVGSIVSGLNASTVYGLPLMSGLNAVKIGPATGGTNLQISPQLVV